MGGYGTYLGFNIRSSPETKLDLAPGPALGKSSSEMHKTLMIAMAGIFFLGANGGLVLCLVQVSAASPLAECCAMRGGDGSVGEGRTSRSRSLRTSPPPWLASLSSPSRSLSNPLSLSLAVLSLSLCPATCGVAALRDVGLADGEGRGAGLDHEAFQRRAERRRSHCQPPFPLPSAPARSCSRSGCSSCAAPACSGLLSLAAPSPSHRADLSACVRLDPTKAVPRKSQR